MHSRRILIVLSVVAAMAVATVVVSAGNPNAPPGPPETTSSYRLEDIYNRLSTGAAGTQIAFTEPISGPTVGTGHTLDEIMAVAPQVDDTDGATASQVVSGSTYWGLRNGAWGFQTGAATAGSNVTGGDGQLAFAIPDGFYTGSKTATAQDADLAAGNIALGVDLFGVIGSVAVATGDATPADVLTGMTFSTESGSGLSGTMPDNGAVIMAPTVASQAIAAGYHDGSGYVQGDADLVAGNIRSGANLFGVAGHPNVVNTASGDAAEGDILGGRVAWVDGSELTGAMANNGPVTITPAVSSQMIAAGYHDGNGYVVGDADLIPGNITSGVNLFGVDGAYPLAPAPKTGQATSYYANDDGDLEMGVDWITATRFITGTTGSTGVTVVVTDTLTGLVWLQDANCINSEYPAFDNDQTAGDGRVYWDHALDFVAGITVTGSYSNCAAGFSDWRLPNVREMQSLIDYGQYNPALPDDYPFTGVLSAGYWSSTTNSEPAYTLYAWYVELEWGSVHWDGKGSNLHVWPVRGGQ
jgi:hypothetical protein